MAARLRSIVWNELGHADMVIDVDGELRPTCRTVVQNDGIRALQVDPDFVHELTISPRLLVAAVVAFDAARDDDS